MAIEGDELGAGFEGVGGDPDVVGGDGRARLAQGGGDATEAVGGGARDDLKGDPGLGQEIIEGCEVLFVAVAVAKAEQQLAHHDHREDDLLGAANQARNVGVALQQLDVGVGVEHALHSLRAD